MYTCFTRTWWKEQKTPYGKKLVPSPGKRTIKATFQTEKEAQDYCKKWNETNNPGKLSRKCEYTSNY